MIIDKYQEEAQEIYNVIFEMKPGKTSSSSFNEIQDEINRLRSRRRSYLSSTIARIRSEAFEAGRAEERQRAAELFWDWFCGRGADNYPATKEKIIAILADDKEKV